jgi:hypothetical protein
MRFCPIWYPSSLLSYENSEDIKVALKVSKFLVFFWLHGKNLHFASANLVSILSIGLGKKIKKNAIFSHF